MVLRLTWESIITGYRLPAVLPHEQEGSFCQGLPGLQPCIWQAVNQLPGSKVPNQLRPEQSRATDWSAGSTGCLLRYKINLPAVIHSSAYHMKVQAL